jgi:hypothetical protein
MTEAAAAHRQALDQFSDWRWRLNNLYWITDKSGHRTLFRMNWAQESLFGGMHYMNVILKARQLGFTTFIQLFMLDRAVFLPDVRCGTIAHTLDDAKVIFRDKVRFPYDHLPDGIKEAVPVVNDNASELMLGNNSSIRVGTSLRSGTLQYLHVSEYGKLCAKYPEKAREVRTGALNTVQAGQVVFIESTAEGQEGHFFEICEAAQTKARMGGRLTELDFRFHFFPWWQEPQYAIDPQGVVIAADMARYFDKLAAQGISLTAAQQAWYVKKAETQLEDMKREYPSTPEEAFEASVEGAYYGREMARAESEGRIGAFPAHAGLKVNMTFDIGMHDYTAIWFWQATTERARIVGFYKNHNEYMPHYLSYARDLYARNGWREGDVWVPHDAKVREWAAERSRLEAMQSAGLYSRLRLVPDHTVHDGINAVRTLLPQCEFDQGECAEGIRDLKHYRKEWDEERAVWRDTPRKDAAAHGADAFRYIAVVYRDVPREVPQKPRGAVLGGVLETSGIGTRRGVTMDELWRHAAQQQQQRRL